MNSIKYKSGYKYQLAEDYRIETCIFPNETIISDYFCLTTYGDLTINKGYAWDGPSGPTIDTKNFMRGALVHDALYQLMREGFLEPSEENRKHADDLLKEICLEDGMSKIRAWYVYRSVRRFAMFAADPKNRKKVIEVP